MGMARSRGYILSILSLLSLLSLLSVSSVSAPSVPALLSQDNPHLLSPDILLNF